MFVEQRLVSVTRWTARVLGTLLFGLILVFLIGEGMPPIDFSVTGAMSIAFVIAWLGLAVLWRWEGIGGLMVVGGMVAFYALNFADSGKFPSGWVFPLFCLPGILTLFSRWRRPRPC